MKKILIALTTMALMAGTAAFAAPQRWQDRDDDRGHGNGRARHDQLYRDGYRCEAVYYWNGSITKRIDIGRCPS
jgi:hypothetical protein